MDNIKEQIERIKSLFTEERLYGNLINESCGCSVEEMEDELESEGYSVYKRGKTDSNCKTTVNATPHLKCIKTFFDGNTDYKNKYEMFEWKRGCVINVKVEGKKFAAYSTKGSTNIFITVFENGTFQGEKKTFVITIKFDTPFDMAGSKEGLMDKAREGIEEIEIRGVMDDDCNIKDLKTVKITDKKGKDTVSIKMEGSRTYYKTMGKLLTLV